MPTKVFVFDESGLVPEDFDRFPVWMNAHWFDEDEVVRRFGPFTRRVTEAARLAYQGPLPYPILQEDSDHPSDVIVKCLATTAAGDKFPGCLTPLLEEGDLTLLAPHVFTPTGAEPLCLGELDAAQQATVLPRWRADIEAALGRPLRDLFPMTLDVPEGILPPGAPSRWTLEGLMYRSTWKPQLVPLA
ncbi:MAG TPA: hypothetical protein VF796_01320 [Humisphaera sp.]